MKNKYVYEYSDYRGIVDKALEMAEIPISEDLPEEFPENLRWQKYYKIIEKEVVYVIKATTGFSEFKFETELISITWKILDDLSNLFDDKNAVKLLYIKEEEGADLTDEAVNILQAFINYLPLVLFQGYHQVFKESIADYIKKYLEPRLRDNWNNEGFEKTYTLLPEKNLKNLLNLFPNSNLQLIELIEIVDDEFTRYRNAAFSDRKVWLTTEKFPLLLKDYEKLRVEYGKAKKIYSKKRKAYFEINRRSSPDDWDNYWKEYTAKEFPELSKTNEIRDYNASQLAYWQLAERFDYTWEYMEKIIGKIRIREMTDK